MDKVDIKLMTEIHRKPDEVQKFMADLNHTARWLPGVHEVKLIKGEPDKPGRQVEYTGGFLGMKLNFVLETAEVIPGTRWVDKSIKSPFPMEYHWNLEPIPEGTRIMLNMKAEPGGFFKLAQPIVSAAVKRGFQASLETLKELVEEKKLIEA